MKYSYHRISSKNNNKVIKKVDNVKGNKCIKCNNKTLQEDSICVVCKINIIQMHTELMDLLKKDRKWNLRTLKIS